MKILWFKFTADSYSALSAKSIAASLKASLLSYPRMYYFSNSNSSESFIFETGMPVFLAKFAKKSGSSFFELSSKAKDF